MKCAWARYRYDYESSRGEKKVDVEEALEPLVQQLRLYDSLRVELEEHGGGLELLAKIVQSLGTKISIQSAYRNESVSLTEGEKLREALREFHYSIRLDVRRLETNMPVYYLFRTKQDPWSQYNFVIEDFYMSPGYPLPEERFVRLMRAGHEVYYLRMSQFRKEVQRILERHGKVGGSDVDDCLYRVGRYVLQATWHEDQRVGLAVAYLLRLEHFRTAIELLYLVLTAELCELRGAVEPNMSEFFRQPILRRPFKPFWKSCRPSKATS
jgi:hypothetical protein